MVMAELTSNKLVWVSKSGRGIGVVEVRIAILVEETSGARPPVDQLESRGSANQADEVAESYEAGIVVLGDYLSAVLTEKVFGRHDGEQPVVGQQLPMLHCDRVETKEEFLLD